MCKLDILGERSVKWFDYIMVGIKEGLGERRICLK